MKAEQLQQNFETLIDFINQKFTGKRKEKLLDLYDKLADRIATAPASSKKQYHNAFPGGYVLHVLNVISATEKISNLWKELGLELDFSDEEMYFSALNHDLGKIGSLEEDYYIPCTEEWQKKKGQLYVTNPELQFMKVSERSIFILQQHGISISEKEYLSIKLHDGLYEEGNKSYFISFNEGYELKTYLPYILHQADLLCSKIESKKSDKQVKNIEIVKTNSKALNKFLNE
jgi:hypothetical protein